MNIQKHSNVLRHLYITTANVRTKTSICLFWKCWYELVVRCVDVDDRVLYLPATGSIAVYSPQAFCSWNMFGYPNSWCNLYATDFITYSVTIFTILEVLTAMVSKNNVFCIEENLVTYNIINILNKEMWDHRFTRVFQKTFKILFNIQSNSVMTLWGDINRVLINECRSKGGVWYKWRKYFETK